MSSRNIRKVVGGNVLPPPDPDDPDYEPLYASSTNAPTVNPFDGLCSSSESEKDMDVKNYKESDEEDLTKQQKPAQNTRKKSNDKRKKRRKNQHPDPFQMDDIDQSLREVNELLGSPPPAPESSRQEGDNIEDILFGVNNKYLNPSHELRKLLGPDLEEEARNRRRGRHYNINKTGLIIPVEERFRKVGLTMSMTQGVIQDGHTYFTIDHDQNYQRQHKIFLRILLASRDDFPDLNISDVVEGMHVEEILQVTEILFAMEEYERAKKLIEKVVAYLQFISHPLFRITDRKVRLDYKFIENRVYHVAMLKYIYVLTNSACHRTALELCKVLLNLDSTDPLAVIILVDMLALRAREHKWLIDVIDYWKTTRDADYLFNLLYSYALAKFHIIKKEKGDLAEADAAIKFAMKRFPTVVPELFKVTNNKSGHVENCNMFKDKLEMSKSMKNLWHDLLKYYTLFTASKWREPDVWAWFLRNVVEMTQQYNSDLETRKYVKTQQTQRAAFLRCLPQQVVRHFQIIKFMNNFVFDEIIFTMRPGVASYNPEPWPPEDVNRYQYSFTRHVQVNERTFGLFGDFVRSLAPEFMAVQQVLEENQEQARVRRGEPPRGGNGQGPGEQSIAELYDAIREHLLSTVGQHLAPIDTALLEAEDDDRWDLVLPNDNLSQGN